VSEAELTCAYCGREKESATRCLGCNSKEFVAPTKEPWEKAQPFVYNGLIVLMERRVFDLMVRVHFWRGPDYLGVVSYSHEDWMRDCPEGVVFDVSALLEKASTEGLLDGATITERSGREWRLVPAEVP